MNISLSDQVVLVTGGSRGIGAAIVRGMSGAGASVAIHCNQNLQAADQLRDEIGGRSAVFSEDLSQPGAGRRLFDAVVDHFGTVHTLVNNAGICQMAPLEGDDEVWDQSWIDTLAVNLVAVGDLCRAAVKRFLQQEGGRIVNISSRAAFRGDTSSCLAYAASKGGMVSLTRSIARAYGKNGVMAFDIAPGFTRTDMADDFIQEYGEAYVTGDLALSEITEPEDIAPMVVLLASGLADHATGTTIDFNAGSYVH